MNTPNGITPPGIGRGRESTCGLPCAAMFVDNPAPTANPAAVPKNCRRETVCVRERLSRGGHCRGDPTFISRHPFSSAPMSKAATLHPDAYASQSDERNHQNG